MLELAEKLNIKILHASTSEIYGNPTQHPQKESYFGSVNPIGIRSCYDEGKRIAETLFTDFHRYKKVDVRIVRIFNTYGPRMSIDDGRVVSNFIVQCLQNKPITVYGDGSQTRSFCYVEDLIKGIINLMNSQYTSPVNIGNPKELTINYLANKIKNAINPKLEITYKVLPSDDPLRRKPDISIAKKELGWEPEIELKEGLEKTINWFKSITLEK